jgi:hypothetical protein
MSEKFELIKAWLVEANSKTSDLTRMRVLEARMTALHTTQDEVNAIAGMDNPCVHLHFQRWLQ